MIGKEIKGKERKERKGKGKVIEGGGKERKEIGIKVLRGQEEKKCGRVQRGKKKGQDGRKRRDGMEEQSQGDRDGLVGGRGILVWFGGRGLWRR